MGQKLLFQDNTGVWVLKMSVSKKELPFVLRIFQILLFGVEI